MYHTYYGEDECSSGILDRPVSFFVYLDRSEDRKLILCEDEDEDKDEDENNGTPFPSPPPTN